MNAPVDHSRCIVNRPPELRGLAWTDFLFELAEVLERVLQHGRAFVVLSEPGFDAFVQLCVTADGDVFAEAAGTMLRPGCCPGRHRLTVEQSSKLASLGWNAPHEAQEGPILWVRQMDERWHSPAALYSELFVRTLVEVFNVESPIALSWRFGNMPRDGRVARAA